jgi:hypothetical protein
MGLSLGEWRKRKVLIGVKRDLHRARDQKNSGVRPGARDDPCLAKKLSGDLLADLIKSVDDHPRPRRPRLGDLRRLTGTSIGQAAHGIAGVNEDRDRGFWLFQCELNRGLVFPLGGDRLSSTDLGGPNHDRAGGIRTEGAGDPPERAIRCQHRRLLSW